MHVPLDLAGLKMLISRPMQFLEFTRVLLPSLILLSSLYWTRIENPPVHVESFGDEENYLTLQFPTNLRVSERSFQGNWTTDDGERQVHGKRKVMGSSVQYEMELPEGRFLGKLHHPSKGCEPHLNFTVEKNGKLVRHGKLRAAFCL